MSLHYTSVVALLITATGNIVLAMIPVSSLPLIFYGSLDRRCANAAALVPASGSMKKAAREPFPPACRLRHF
jgi:hypothetical protein